MIESTTQALADENMRLMDEVNQLRVEVASLKLLLNTHEAEDFDKDFDKEIPLEAAHLVQRWRDAQDSGKDPADWFWLFWMLSYLGGKALTAVKAGDMEKAKHHSISSAAVLRTWHAHLRTSTRGTPGVVASA